MVLVGGVLFLSLLGNSGCQDESLSHYLSQCESLPDQIRASHLVNSQAIRRLVLAHSKGLPDLRKAIHEAPSWKVRLAACFVVMQMGRGDVMVEATDDGNAFVRNFARAALKNKPRKRTDDSGVSEPYSIDPPMRAWADALSASTIPFTETEKRERIRSTVRDLLDVPNPLLDSGEDKVGMFNSAYRLALADPGGYVEALCSHGKVSNDGETLVRTLSAIRLIASGAGGAARAVYEGSQQQPCVGLR